MIEAVPAGAAPGRGERFGRWLENTLLALVLFIMIGLAAAEVLFRTLSDGGLPWADEALRLLVLWAAMLGAIAASRDNVHLRIDLLSRFLPQALQRFAALVVDLFAAGVSAVLAWYSWGFVTQSRAFDDRVLGSWPAWPFQAILPVAFGLIAYRYLARLPRHLRPPNAPAGQGSP